MARVLMVAEHDGSALKPGTARCVTCARALAPESLTVVVLAAGAGAVADEAARLAGVTRVLACDDARHAAPLAAVLAP